MTVRMRHTRGHTANRRSHHALGEARLSKCTNCGAMHMRHQMCPTCGMYNGRTVVDVKAHAERRLTRRNDRLKARGLATEKADAPSEK